jgi:ribosomal-protein-alanine N-acetyltransferase
VRRPDAEIARDRLRSAGGHPAGDEDDRAGAASPARFRVRRAGGEADLAAVEALQRETFTNPWGAGAIRWELEHTDVARLYLLEAPDAGVIGYCACWIVFDELHINSLAIDAAWRRRGAATHLLESVFAETIRAGARTATLEVRASNVAARRLYERLGFRVEGTRRDYYQQPREDALILWCRDLAGRTPAARPA